MAYWDYCGLACANRHVPDFTKCVETCRAKYPHDMANEQEKTVKPPILQDLVLPLDLSGTHATVFDSLAFHN
jgi:hypothetical protein